MTKPRSRRPKSRRAPSSTRDRPAWRFQGPGALIGLAGLLIGGALLLVSAIGDDGPPDEVGAGTAGVTGADFHSLVADPTTPGQLYVGGHQAVSRSADGGRTWRRVGALDDADAMGWAFPDGAVFVSGHPGLNRSDDDAATFQRINDGLPGTDLHALGAGNSVLYAAAADAGLLASTDDGATWELRATDGTQAFFGRIVVDPDDDEHLYAADVQRGVAESTDGGRSWTILESGLPAVAWLSHSRDTLAVLIASGPAGAARSTDGGHTWSPLALPVAGNTLVEVDPSDPATVYAGTHDGAAVRVRVSRDGGGTWGDP